ncbi:MAG: hypothetical protein NTW51_11475 [Cyanobacteria bacterium]|nr:hypothetical protein [Cyanobacteriota bacterium]
MPGLPVLPVVLIDLVLLNGLALFRPRGGALGQVVGTGLLLPLLLVASLPTPPQVRGPLLLIAASAITLLLGWGLLAPLWGLWAAEGNGATRKAAGIDTTAGMRFVITALALSLGTALLFALRPNPYEYPGDTVDYLNTFQRLTQAGHPPTSCLTNTWRVVTYWRACTLWTTLLEASPMDSTALLSGLPQRTTIGLEIAVLGLTVFRLLRSSRVGPLAAGLSWVLMVFGLGNQSIAFLVNNALQGSILAAVVFVESALLVVWLVGQRMKPTLQAAALLFGMVPFLYLELKLHGAFALTTLVLLLPMMLLLALRSLTAATSPRLLPRRTAVLLLLGSLALLVLVLGFKTGWPVLKEARPIVRWSFLQGLGIAEANLPSSYLPRSPGSRPELVAVAALLASLGALFLPQAPPETRANGQLPTAFVYREVSSLYGLAVLMAFLVPPFSHLFINLPYEISSNYRLMWGVILFSPLPLLIDSLFRRGGYAPRQASGARIKTVAGRMVLGLLFILVLIPIPSGSRTYPQRFWSKSRHLLQGPSPRVDLQRLSRALLPSIREAGGPIRKPVVLADELIATALEGYPNQVSPIDPMRIYSRRDPGYNKVNADLRRLPPDRMRGRIEAIKPQPDLVIQEQAIAPYYTPYGEINVYDKDGASHVSQTGVNAIPSDLFQTLGFRLWRNLDASGRVLPLGDPNPTYRLWRRLGN